MTFKTFSSFVCLMLAFTFAGCEKPTRTAGADQNSGSETTTDSDQKSPSAESSDTESTSASDTKTEDAKETGSATKPTTGSDSKSDAASAIEIAGGKLTLNTPAGWKSVEPSSRMLSYEMAIEKVEGEVEDVPNGRFTIMSALGSMEQNIQRWHGQFKQPDGSSTEDHTEITDMKAGGYDIKMVDLKGTFLDRPAGAPMFGGAKIERPDYRKVVAVIQAGDLGQYFFNFYGPQKTVEANMEKFKEMINSLSKTE